MRKSIILSLALLSACAAMNAQRVTDVLDRGLVAVDTEQGVFCSWRINAEEWYDVEYNIYRDGTLLNSQPLKVSNFLDAEGSASSTYTVAPVVDGAVKSQCEKVAVLAKNYMVIQPLHDPSLTSTYVPNDACCADVDGDGVLEILMKYDNRDEINASYPYDGWNGEYSLFECLKLDGTVLWWVNCGPNMGDFQNNEQNIIAYDWDCDGRAEAVFRAADGTTIHMADGEVYTVGDPTINYRGATGGGANWFMHSGKEYLLYVDGATGKPYQCIDYPLPRLDEDENPNGLLSGGAYDNLVNQAWGDGYGHRSTKHFFGAPYLDGRKPSIFLARGIYTRHKMIAYDVDPDSHALVERWRWKCYEPGAWYAQGYHNYSVADVDWDGRDEIVFGSMVIDDNGHGLSTTGLGHGDSHHVGDFDPYSHGQEVFACNEDNPNNNFRDATTSKIYYRTTGGNDDGRANMGNFIDEYPGAQGVSSRDPNLVGAASHAGIIGDNKSTVTITQNFRIYWDGDLCDESFDYNSGKNTAGAIFKARQGRIDLLEGSMTNNDTKGTPCYQGDILGDWREEVIMRDSQNNIRIYTTTIPTPWRIYTLWHDPQYRNAMVWQMCGYNQTPHPSFYIGEYEGITVPPAPVTMTGRTEVAAGGTISHELDGKHVIVCETADMDVNVADGAAPKVLTVNAPSWVQGHDDNANITTTYYTHTLKGGALAGDMRMVKQGDGTLVLPAAEHSYSGDTEVWAGTLQCDGTLSKSHLWVNRFGKITTSGGKFMGGIETFYASELNIGTDEAPSTLETTDLKLGFGTIVNIDLFDLGDAPAADKIIAQSLSVEVKDWDNGPEMKQPVMRVSLHLPNTDAVYEGGKFLIAEIAQADGIENITLEGVENMKKTIVTEDGKIYLELKRFETGAKTWTGLTDGLWNIDDAANFSMQGKEEPQAFYPGDDVTFDDTAECTDVVIEGSLMPNSVTFNNSEKDYTLSGDGSIVGSTSIVKNGTAALTIRNVNQYTGHTYINDGKLTAGSFANTIGTDLGALGGIDNRIYISNNATLCASSSCTVGQSVTIKSGHATIETPTNVELTLQKGVATADIGQVLYKSGKGTLTLSTDNKFSKLVILEGAVNDDEKDNVIQLPAIVEFVNGALYDLSNIYSYSTNRTNFVVESGNSGSLYLDARCEYTGKLTGAGRLTVYAASVRNYLKGDWSEFTGTVVAGLLKRGSSYDPDFIWDNDYGLPNGTFNIPSNITVNAGAHPMTLGNLKGSGTLNTTGKVTVGSSNENLSLVTKISGTPDFEKVGTGDWIISAPITSELKSITASDGIVSLTYKDQQGQVLFKPLTLKDGVLMRGRGKVESIMAESGAILEPGYYTTSSDKHYGPIYATGDVTLEPGATLSLYIRKGDDAQNSRSYLNVAGTLTIDGRVVVVLDPDYQPSAGDKATVWIAGTFAGTPTLELPELPSGLFWDLTQIEAGILGITDTDALESICIDGEGVGQRYNIYGQPVGADYRGIVILKGRKILQK